MPSALLRFTALLVFIAAASSLVWSQTPAQKQQAQQLYLQASGLEAKKDNAGAARLMVKALELTPKNDAFLAYLAKLEFQSGQVVNAISHGREALELKPGNAVYLGLVMRGAFAGKDYETAKEFAKKSLALGSSKVGGQLVEEAKSVLNKADILNAEVLFVAATTTKASDKILAAQIALTAAVKAEPKVKLHRDRLAALEPLLRTAELDKHALAAPPDAEQSLDRLAEYLVKPAKTDREKVRIIYRWITDRIAYDAKSYFTKTRGDNSPDGVLKSRLAVCEGYANLFQHLARRAGLEEQRVTGSAKDFGFQSDKTLASHAWNAVKVDGQWQLVDSTWGAGSLNDKTFKKEFNDFYLFVAPERLIFTHLPSDDRWQLLDPVVTRGEFEMWPRIGRQIFQVQPDLSAAKIRVLISQKDFKDFATFFKVATPFKMIDGPLSAHLTAGKTYKFEFDAPGYEAIVFMIDGKPAPLERKGSHFEGRLTPRRGTVMVMGRLPDDPRGRFNGLIQYEVE